MLNFTSHQFTRHSGWHRCHSDHCDESDIKFDECVIHSRMAWLCDLVAEQLVVFVCFGSDLQSIDRSDSDLLATCIQSESIGDSNKLTLTISNSIQQPNSKLHSILVQLSISHFFVDSFIDSEFIVESKSIVIGQQECEWIGIAQQQRIGEWECEWISIEFIESIDEWHWFIFTNCILIVIGHIEWIEIAFSNAIDIGIGIDESKWQQQWIAIDECEWISIAIIECEWIGKSFDVIRSASIIESIEQQQSIGIGIGIGESKWISIIISILLFIQVIIIIRSRRRRDCGEWRRDCEWKSTSSSAILSNFISFHLHSITISTHQSSHVSVDCLFG